jgi:proteic killer suppression protein
VIVSYRNKQTEDFSNGHRVRAYENIDRSGRLKLNRMKAFETVDDLAGVPGNRIEKLRGDREGQFSIRINDQWRICFRWDDIAKGFADVEIVDYH